MIKVVAPQKNILTQVALNGSKSIANRVLLLNYLLKQNIELQNNSTSHDTQLLQKALEQISNSTSATINIEHAGTDMRFLTAALSVTKGEWILTGSERMKQRPINILVDALKFLGAEITYLENEGFPPLKIIGKDLNGGEIVIPANVSSQYISALLLMAPILKSRLVIKLKGELVSSSYIKMTIGILNFFCVEFIDDNKTIIVFPYKNERAKLIRSNKFFVESDWSSASYWFSITAFAKHCNIQLNSFSAKSLQADSVVKRIYQMLGVKNFHLRNQLTLINQKHSKNFSETKFEYDFIDCPDLAPTVAVTCLGLGIDAHLKGLQTLKIKESDRILALKTELEKFGAKVITDENSIQIFPDKEFKKHEGIIINSHNDHRLAMSFAPLCLLHNSILIDDGDVVKKSYPEFWNHLESAGFSVYLEA